jgi:hypothetical protein
MMMATYGLVLMHVQREEALRHNFFNFFCYVLLGTLLGAFAMQLLIKSF